ncbi:MAG TPA: divalent metal cation transporter [Caulobacteraceae bacterium]|nr:divalent metal cation transporter [Caulobacteraceae bacterium]
MSETAAAAPAKRGPLAILQVFGPGLITGASDDDPSGIATYSQAGAQYGYGLEWTLLFSWPLMCAIQEICARIGRVTGHGIAGNLKRAYPRGLVFALVGLLLVANTINLGADLGAMGAALRLLVGGPQWLLIAAFAVLSVLLEVFVRYKRYAAILKWLALSLLSYVAVAFAVKVPWGTVAWNLVAPSMGFDVGSLTVVVAVLGTTISPYLFFWQASEEAEEVEVDPDAEALKSAPEEAPAEFRRIRIDTYLGMAFSNAVALFIMIATAATLHAHGVTNIQTSSQAAEALKPVAGPLVFFIFALGIVGTGLLTVPVLAGSGAYALGELFGWKTGLDRALTKAKPFYGVIAAATLIGALSNFSGLDPIKALFWSAVINGVVAVPVMVMVMLIAGGRKIMGDFVLPPMLKIAGWLATAVMALAAVGMFATMAMGSGG